MENVLCLLIGLLGASVPIFLMAQSLGTEKEINEEDEDAED